MKTESRLWALWVLGTAVICANASLFASPATVGANGGSLIGGVVELVPEETLVAISTTGSNVRVAGDEAGPDGREWQEDADDGGALRGELRNSIIELEAGEDGWIALVIITMIASKETYLG
jgi:hypothetical protein